ncbi:Druantia anti-phage system protein DruA [Clostridium estertheticum]|uniref:Druantia anti-phage system protein DruA n=1 Tax=Clostridium estertheticum TaxID=238834 RepID=UPI0013E93CF4
MSSISASAWALKSRDEWIGWSIEDKNVRLHFILNNSRFLIFPWVNIKNLASKVLALSIKQIQIDWLT